jgi:adhesin transport system outer membrane protein
MLEMNFNLYRGGSDAASIRKSKNEKLRAEQDALDIERQVEEDVRTAYSFYKATGKLLPVLRNLTNENAQVVSSYTDQFRMGQRTLVDLVSAQKSLFSSQQVFLNGMTAHSFSYYRLCMPVSQLMSALGVDLKVKDLGEAK